MGDTCCVGVVNQDSCGLRKGFEYPLGGGLDNITGLGRMHVADADRLGHEARTGKTTLKPADSSNAE